MRISKKIVFLLVSLFVAKSEAAPKSSPGRISPKSSKQEYFVGVGDVDNKTESELINMIKGFRFLLKQETQPQKKAQLILSEAGAYLALAKIYRVRTPMTPSDIKKEKTCNQRVVTNVMPVLKSKEVSRQLKAKGFYYHGLALINLNKIDAGANSFIDSLGWDKESGFAPLISIFLAEQSFEKEKYEESIKRYQDYYSRYNDSQKALAIYKIAWANINLQRLTEAERYFLMIAGKKTAGSFAEDSIRDLAYVVTLHRGETDVLEFSRTHFAGKDRLRADFLGEVYFYFQAQSTTKKKPLILQELLRIETDPVKKLKVLIATLRGSQRQYASREPFREYMRIRDEMKKMSISKSNKEFSEVSEELEIEIKNLIRSFGESFQGKTKTPESFTPDELGNHITDLLAFHIEYYPQSTDREKSYDLWLSICDQLKRYQCLYDISHQVFRLDKVSDSLLKAAKIDNLKALEFLSQKNNALRAELLTELKEYVGKYKEDDGDWKPISKRLSVMHIEDKNYDEALPLLTRLHAAEKNTESYFRLQYVRFQLGKYDEVVKNEFALGTDKFSQDTLALVRESQLKLAAAAESGNDFVTFEKHILEFMRLNKDPKKGDLALKSYIGKLIDQKMHTRALEELMKIPAQKRYGEQFVNEVQRAVYLMIKQAQLASAKGLLEEAMTLPARSQFEVTYAGLSVSLAHGKIPSMDRFLSYSVKTKEYTLGMMALTTPDRVINYYLSYPVKSATDKKILYLAQQMMTGEREPKLGPRLRAMLSDMVKLSAQRGDEETVSEQQFKLIKYPNLSMSLKKFDTLAQEAVKKVRTLRTQVSKDLASRKTYVQIRILTAALEAEEKVAGFLVEAPVPSSLTPEQAEEYKKGFSQLAQEFANQSQEYLKLKKSLEEKIDSEAQNKLPVPDLGQWGWPEGMEVIKSLLDQDMAFASLFVLDQMKLANDIADPVYYHARSRVLFSIRTHDAMGEYVLSELKQANQNELLDKWKRLKESSL